MAVFSCASGSQALLRHWPYFERQQADRSIVIGTVDRHCAVPEGVDELKIGLDCYIKGPHLPMRLCRTIEQLLSWDWDALILAEYDTLIFNPIKVNKLNCIASHPAGTLAYNFYHNPWVFDRLTAEGFLEEGFKVIESGQCQEGAHAASPDVFFGLVCATMKQPVQGDLWTEFTRNSFDCNGDLERAREAYRNGVDIIHGTKTEKELEYITQ